MTPNELELLNALIELGTAYLAVPYKIIENLPILDQRKIMKANQKARELLIKYDRFQSQF